MSTAASVILLILLIAVCSVMSVVTFRAVAWVLDRLEAWRRSRR